MMSAQNQTSWTIVAVHLERKAREISEGPIFGLIFFKKGQPVAAAF